MRVGSAAAPGTTSAAHAETEANMTAARHPGSRWAIGSITRFPRSSHPLLPESATSPRIPAPAAQERLGRGEARPGGAVCPDAAAPERLRREEESFDARRAQSGGNSPTRAGLLDHAVRRLEDEMAAAPDRTSSAGYMIFSSASTCSYIQSIQTASTCP